MTRKPPIRQEPQAPAISSADEVAQFLEQVQRMPKPAHAGGRRGRLIFSLDATMSRQPTWDKAQHLQAEMFHAAAELGGLSVQLVYYRGFNECRASRWVEDPRRLADLMSRIDCRGGYTQIGRVLGHIRKQAEQRRVAAAVHIGDACEENMDELAQKAGEIALLGVPVFMFQEGYDPVAAAAFSEIARITGGAHCRFDEGSAAQLKELLSAIGTFAAGGLVALEQRTDRGARLLLENLRR
ncbi:VWA domain-containing protein [Thermopetrobacter sp. TC1]|uniref:VWA domain-containing protein n=1 Tax=Thermopetrobacter sp. TC1 TaxID=1495045 RepID=UPI0012E0B8A6|nr:VWA domain-containing protein [Thermopetrobacter sp. TC1]